MRKISHLRQITEILDIDLVFFYFAVQRSPAQTHHFGGGFHTAMGFFEDFLQIGLDQIIQGRAGGHWQDTGFDELTGGRGRQVIAGDNRLGTEVKGSFDVIL